MSLDVAVVISALALIVSIVTLWLTHLRLGTVKITRPSMIYLGPDGEVSNAAKIVLRMLLYSTSLKGRCVEQLFVRLRRNDSSHTFSVWVHGDGEDIIRAAGLMVGPNGVDRMHHFLISRDANFRFQGGDYQLELYMQIVGEKKPKMIFNQRFSVTEDDAKSMNSPKEGLFFDWGPDSQSYQRTIRPTDNELTIPESVQRNGPQ